MKFLDECRINIKSGKGGNGCLSFRREKYIAKGGPDGGSGGQFFHLISREERREAAFTLLSSQF